MKKTFRLPADKTYTRAASFIIVAVVYVLALAVGVLSYLWLAPVLRTSCLAYGPASSGASCIGLGCDWLALFVADVIATVFTWVCGLLWRNVSVYDPYWSVAPPVMMTAWVIWHGSWDVPTILLLIGVWVWAIRLTYNWAITFKGLAHEDWRYTKFRTQNWFIFQVINFFGLNLVPTIVVFLAMLPGFALIESGYSANWLTWVAFLLCLTAPTIQLIADTQSHAFRRAHPGEVCNVGLWKHGRHPNYFGEVLMWWAVWFLYASVTFFPTLCGGACGLGGVESVAAGASDGAATGSLWAGFWLISGAIANTLLFLCISIPLMEARQLKNKPGYAEYRRHTRLFI